MAWFQSKHEQLVENLQEEQVYALVAFEVADGEIRPGLWVKAFAEAAGNEQRAQGIYINLRVAQLKLGVEITAQMIARIEKLLSTKAPTTKEAPKLPPPPVAAHTISKPVKKWQCLRCGPTTVISNYTGGDGGLVCSTCRGHSGLY